MAKYKTIGILTGGGDCPGLNAVIRAAVKGALGHGIRVWGVQNGFGGLVEDQMIELNDRNVSGILPRGGTILGTTNRDNPFAYAKEIDGKLLQQDMSEKALDNLHRKKIEALIVIGGDGSLAIAAKFNALGFPIVGVPKTIDNDIAGTERTFGFDTAVGIACDALDRLHTTAESHHRVMILEVMGRYAGWIALHAGLAGGADCILIPEIPYHMELILDKINRRCQVGKHFSIIVVAEGAKPVDGEITISQIVEGSHEKIRLGGVGAKLAREIESLTGLESRCTVLGHVQRGGTPTAFDRVLCTRYGVAAAECLFDGFSGCMVALRQDRIIRLPLAEVAGICRQVETDDELVSVGRAIGVCFGDEIV